MSKTYNFFSENEESPVKSPSEARLELFREMMRSSKWKRLKHILFYFAFRDKKKKMAEMIRVLFFSSSFESVLLGQKNCELQGVSRELFKEEYEILLNDIKR